MLKIRGCLLGGSLGLIGGGYLFLFVYAGGC